MSAQLAGSDRLQAAAIRQRDHVLAAQPHRLGDRRLIDRPAHDEHRHARRVLLPHLHDGREIHAELFDEGNQHFRIELRQGIAQVAGIGQPGAVNRMARLAQSAVDRFDVVLRPRHHDHWNCTLFCQRKILVNWPKV